MGEEGKEFRCSGLKERGGDWVEGARGGAAGCNKVENLVGGEGSKMGQSRGSGGEGGVEWEVMGGLEREKEKRKKRT